MTTGLRYSVATWLFMTVAVIVLATTPAAAQAAGGENDCDGNGIPDDVQLAAAAAGCSFPSLLIENGTTASDATFLGPPDGVYFGLGGQIVTWEIDCGAVVDAPGPDLTLYELASGGAEFGLVDLLVSLDGIDFVSLKASESPAINVPGDGGHGNNTFARSYDLAGSGLTAARYVRVDGSGTGASGPTTGFDLDGLGIIHVVTIDCDASGVLDSCEALPDCNGNGVPDGCELTLGAVSDCDANGTPDTCDTLGGMNDCDGDTVPDSCEPDCNGNGTPDDCDIAAATSADCNGNGVPDECDLSATAASIEGSLTPIGSGFNRTFTVPSAFPAAGDVTVSVTAAADLNASNEYLDLTINGLPAVRLYETGGQQCVPTATMAVLPASAFNLAIAGGDATIGLAAPSTVSAAECPGSFGTIALSYTPIVDCNANGNLDACDIAAATSTDLNGNGIADDCEADCNANQIPDDYEIAQGINPDCNANGVPDACDIAAETSADCNLNQVPDDCEVDCNANGVPDDCDIAAATSADCNLNQVPDECDLADGAGGCPFPRLLLDNGTTAADATFLGPPDGIYFGLGGQVVTFEFDCGFIADGPGSDFTLYEVSVGAPEFNLLDDVQVSADGVTFVSVRHTEAPAVRIAGDEQHTNITFARSYDIYDTGLNAVRFVRIDGSGTGASGSATGFDLDALGAIHRVGVDCDGSGVPDSCESFDDCNLNALPDSCEIALGLDDDCNENGILDSCDIVAGAADVDFDWIPDVCEPDCNANAVPDHYDIEQGTSTDCNHNAVPDECDLASGTSEDCNADMIPDECPICPVVEVVFVMDTSSSMDDEGSALCTDLQQVVAGLQADLVNVDVELLGIHAASGYGCLTSSVANLYGTAVPGSPPPGMETLGEPCGIHLNEDWGPATAIVAGLKPWQADSVRLIVPISDEGPRCGDPVNNPGDDRDSINLAIGQAQLNDVIVSPIGGSGSSAAVVNMMNLIADATNGQQFSSSDPSLDLAAGIRGILVGACNRRSDCNANSVPDDCDLAAMTSQDCNLNGRPDECEMDCNGNGLHDSCDIAAMTSADVNGNTIPDECEGITLTAGPANWEWSTVSGALGYDLVRGDLGILRSTGGDFSPATDQCLANDSAGTTWPLGVDPAAGEALWYLVRGVLGTANLTYDSFGPGLFAGRDPAIEASGATCP